MASRQELVALPAAVQRLLSLTRVRGRTEWVLANERVPCAPPADPPPPQQAIQQPPLLDSHTELRRLTGRGIGLVARRQIAAGERVLAEAPLARLRQVVWPSRAEAEAELDKVLWPLSATDRAQFDSLSQSEVHGRTSSPLGVWLTNALPISYDEAGSDEAAVFATISRINHSCVPNAHHEWNANLGKETITAIAPIAPGEELTICYRASLAVSIQGPLGRVASSQVNC